MRSIAIALGLAAMGWSAAAQPGPSIITMPDWSAKPTGEDLAGVYPEAAMKAGLEGRATIACVTTADGLLADCQVVAEDPPGAGFGDAALTLSARFRMRPMTKDGHAVAGGKVRIPIVFRLPAPAPAPAALLDHPDWVHRPKGEEVTRVYPLEAERRHVSGGAVLSCSVTAEGRLTACQATDEQPPRMGFGRAALKLAPLFQMSAMTKDGQSVAGGTVRIPIIFRVW